jgi:hypothetical protein
MTTTKRAYNRRSDEDRIAELQAKIEAINAKVAAKSRPDGPVLKELPRVQRRLRRFADTCNACGRADMANSIVAFLAGLERAADLDPNIGQRRARKNKDE